jgi:hypothetical protein
MGWTAEELGFDSRKEQDIFLLLIAFRPDLGPTQTPVQWVLRLFSFGLCNQGVKLTTRLLLVQGLRMLKALSPLPIYLHSLPRDISLLALSHT